VNLDKNEEYFKILEGIYDIINLNKENDSEFRQFTLEILKPWAAKFVEFSEKKVTFI
jgi:hypothetical protein